MTENPKSHERSAWITGGLGCLTGITVAIITVVGGYIFREPIRQAAENANLISPVTQVITVEVTHVMLNDIATPTLNLTRTPIPSAQDFFVEEFEEKFNIDNWFDFYFSDSGLSYKISQQNDGLTFDIDAEDTYIYYIYNPYIYTDVALSVRAENRGRNNNNVTLVCRLDYDNDEWYEFSVSSGGLWYLYARQNGYNILDNGGSNLLIQGGAINEYGMTCYDNVITLYINGEKLKSYTDRKYNLKDGMVGLSVSSFNVLPVKVDILSFEIAKP